jgi:hypothetical protein
VQVWQVLHGQQITNQFHVQSLDAWDEAGLVALGATVIEAWNDRIATVQCSDVSYDHVNVRDMTTEEGLGITAGFPLLSGGDRVTPAEPGNVAIACKLLTNFSGRNRQGRIFLGGLDSEAITANQLDDVYRNFIETAVRDFIQDVNATGVSVVIASYFDGMALQLDRRGQTVWTPQPRETALLTPVQNVTVERFTDSMRSRLQGRGN